MWQLALARRTLSVLSLSTLARSTVLEKVGLAMLLRREKHHVDPIVPAVQKTTLWLRIFLDYAKKVSYAGTWGAGLNGQNTIHVQDMADVVLFVLRAALDGKADEGAKGFCESHSSALPGCSA